MRALSCIAFLILSIFSIAYSEDQPVKADYEWPMYSVVRGKVYQVSDKQPLEGVTVKAKNPFVSQLNFVSALTDNTGSYTLLIRGKSYGLEPNENNFKNFPNKLREERYTLTFEKDGYIPAQKNTSVRLKLFLLPAGLINKIDRQNWEDEHLLKKTPADIPVSNMDIIYLKEKK